MPWSPLCSGCVVEAEEAWVRGGGKPAEHFVGSGCRVDQVFDVVSKVWTRPSSSSGSDAGGGWVADVEAEVGGRPPKTKIEVSMRVAACAARGVGMALEKGKGLRPMAEEETSGLSV